MRNLKFVGKTPLVLGLRGEKSKGDTWTVSEWEYSQLQNNRAVEELPRLKPATKGVEKGKLANKVNWTNVHQSKPYLESLSSYDLSALHSELFGSGVNISRYQHSSNDVVVREILEGVWECGWTDKPKKQKPKAEPKRARDDKGRLKGDDPKTPNVNEAWEGGKAPAKTKEKPNKFDAVRGSAKKSKKATKRGTKK